MTAAIHTTREQRRQLERDNAKLPAYLCQVPQDQWPTVNKDCLTAVWRSRDFLVQVFAEEDGVFRLSVNRTIIDVITGRWVEAITWDELQRLKAECGYGARDAVEVYPSDRDVVNVANMRHLWVMPTELPFKWKRK